MHMWNTSASDLAHAQVPWTLRMHLIVTSLQLYTAGKPRDVKALMRYSTSKRRCICPKPPSQLTKPCPCVHSVIQNISASCNRQNTQIICICWHAGLIHFAQNLQCKPAQFIASFPSADPGTSTVIASVFQKLPEFVLRATLGLDDSIIQAIVQKVSSVSQANPSLDTACLNRCGITIPSDFFSDSPSGVAPDGY